MTVQKETGNKGEEIACHYLTKKGFTILERNWIAHPKEIDIIALKNNMLHIVEVKTRTYVSVAAPKMAVSRQKQRNLVAAANNYINIKQIDYEVCFDVISIVYRGKSYEVEFVEDAFYPLV